MLTRGVYMFSEITFAIVWSWLFFHCQYIDYWFLIFSKLLLSFLVFSNAFVQPVSTSVVSSPSKIAQRSKFHTSSSFPYGYGISWSTCLPLLFSKEFKQVLCHVDGEDCHFVEIIFPWWHWRQRLYRMHVVDVRVLFLDARLVPHSDSFCRDLLLSHMLKEEGLKEIIRRRNEGVVCMENRIKSCNSTQFQSYSGSKRTSCRNQQQPMPTYPEPLINHFSEAHVSCLGGFDCLLPQLDSRFSTCFFSLRRSWWRCLWEVS